MTHITASPGLNVICHFQAATKHFWSISCKHCEMIWSGKNGVSPTLTERHLIRFALFIPLICHQLESTVSLWIGSNSSNRLVCKPWIALKNIIWEVDLVVHIVTNCKLAAIVTTEKWWVLVWEIPVFRQQQTITWWNIVERPLHGINYSVTCLVLTWDDSVLWKCHKISVSLNILVDKPHVWQEDNMASTLREQTDVANYQCQLSLLFSCGWAFVRNPFFISVDVWLNNALSSPLNRFFFSGAHKKQKCFVMISWHLSHWNAWIIHLRKYFNQQEGDVGTGCYCLSKPDLCDLWPFSHSRKLAVKSRATSRMSWKRSLFHCSHFKQGPS